MASRRQREFARSLRRNLTPAEKVLWSLLRNRQLAGFRFRRQHPFGPYVLDFYSAVARLVVELDGDSHTTDAGREHDRVRHEFLTRHGIQTLRVWYPEVSDNPDGILDLVYNTCVERTPLETTR